MIPSRLYNKIVASMPIPTVEAMIVKDNSLLLLRRKNDPARGEWWFPGGRIRKGETFKEALLRKVKEETGLNVEIVRFIGVYNRIFPERHDIVIAFLCNCSDDTVVLNEEHTEYKFFKEIPFKTNPFLREIVQDLGWNQKTTRMRAH